MIIPLCQKCGLNPLLPVELNNAKSLYRAVSMQRDDAKQRLQKIKRHAQSALSSFDTLDSVDALDNAKCELRDLLKQIPEKVVV